MNKKEKRNQRLSELKKKSKQDLLSIFNRYIVNSANIRTPRQDLISAIIEIEIGY